MNVRSISPARTRRATPRRHVRMLVTSVVAAACAVDISAQVARSSFPVTLGSGSIKGLPFDEPFQITTTATKELREVRLWVGPARAFSRDQCTLVRPTAAAGASGGHGKANVSLTAQIASTRLLVDSLEKQPAATARSLPDVTERVTTLTKAISVLSARAVSSTAARDSLVAKRAELDTALAQQSEESRKSFDRQRALASARLLSYEPTATWARRGLDSVLTIALDVGALEPNMDYTFCYQLVQSPSADDLAKFKTDAGVRLTAAVRAMAGRALEGIPAIDGIQVALLSAIPQVDSIQVSATSVLSRPAGKEDDAAKRQRLNRLVQFYSEYRTAFEDRRNGLGDVERAAQRVDTALRAFVRDTATLRRLATLARDARAAQNRIPAFTTASSLARRLAISGSLEDWYFSDVARGTKPLDDVSAVRRVDNLGEAWTVTPAKDRDAMLARTEALVDSLRDLAAFALSEPTLTARYATTGRPSAAATAAFESSIGSLVGNASTLLARIADERAHLANLAASIELANGMVVKLVGSITALDFAYVSLLGSTAVTNQARALSYVSLDVGLGGGRGVRSVVPYFGVNLYFRPVNKNMHLPFPSGIRALNVMRRFALTLGVTASSVKEADRVDDLFSSRAVMLGAGLRLTDYWRVTGGALLLKSFPDGKDNPAKAALVPAWGTSIDLDILNALGKIPGFLIPNFK
jgi:hypothetical protein